MKPIVAIIIAATALSLGSCKLGQKYVKPSNTGMPTAFDPTVQTDTISIADLKWQEVYSDSILQSLIEKTLANNKDLLAADARIKELAAQSRVAKADLFPSITGNAYTQKEALNYGGDGFSNDPEIGIKLSIGWEADLWGNLRWAKDRSIAQLLGSIEAQRALNKSYSPSGTSLF